MTTIFFENLNNLSVREHRRWREKVEVAHIRQGNTAMENKDNFNNPTNPLDAPTSGPQFNLENKSGWGKRVSEWVNRYGSSVILPVIALLILAGGIYLYSNQNTKNATLSLGEDAAITHEEEFSQEKEFILSETDESVEKETKEIAETIIPESRKENGAIIESAAPGEGVTHLARRALKNYTLDNPENLTNEHKLYIEDYIKDSIGSRPIEVGEEITFSEDLIKEAINASLELTPEQLSNLEKYSSLVVSW